MELFIFFYRISGKIYGVNGRALNVSKNTKKKTISLSPNVNGMI